MRKGKMEYGILPNYEKFFKGHLERKSRQISGIVRKKRNKEWINVDSYRITGKRNDK